MTDDANEGPTLPPYTGDAAGCVKCGQRGADRDGDATIGTRWVRRLEETGPVSNEPVPLPGGGWAIPVAAVDPDGPAIDRRLRELGLRPGQQALMRVCGRCGYLWPEATLDDPDLAVARLTGGDA